MSAWHDKVVYCIVQQAPSFAFAAVTLAHCWIMLMLL